MLLEARRARPFSSTHRVWGFCGEIATVDVDGARGCGEFTLDGQRYRVHRARARSGPFVLDGPNGVLAEARKPATGQAFEIVHYERRLNVEPTLHVGLAYVVNEGTAQRGEVRRRMALRGRKLEVEIAPEVPLPVEVFVTWLVLLLAQRREIVATAWD
jgi:hypothetical protein